MSVTDRTIAEMERTIHALIAYRDTAKEGGFSGKEHAAAFRATLDCASQLLLWRDAPAGCYPNKVK